MPINEKLDMLKLNPSQIILPRDDDDVKNFLTYDDLSVRYLIQRHKRNYRMKGSNPEWWIKHLETLEAKKTKCLLSYDDVGNPITYSGLHTDLNNRFGWNLVDRSTTPEDKLIPWKRVPFDMRYYQSAAVDKLIEHKHGAVELPTGSGKTLIILNLCKKLGIPATIVTPFKAVTDAIYEDFVHHFGKENVGKYGGGKKELGKLFTVCVSASLLRIEEGSDAWKHFSSNPVLLFDESHTTPAETFKSVCLGLCKDATYRFFLSATQLRVDGSEMLLRGIIGPVVYRKTFKDLVDEKYLKQPIFKSFVVTGPSHNYQDPKKELQHHHLFNHQVLKNAAEIANKAINLADRQTIILVDEFKQFAMLENHLKVGNFEFCHGGATKDNKKIVAEKYWKSDTANAVKRFNEGKTKLLIGTSAIITGVDFKPVGCLIYLMGGKSEIKIRQSLGRGTRVVKDLPLDFWFIDFYSKDSTMMKNQYKARRLLYETMGDIETYDL